MRRRRGALRKAGMPFFGGGEAFGMGNEEDMKAAGLRDLERKGGKPTGLWAAP